MWQIGENCDVRRKGENYARFTTYYVVGPRFGVANGKIVSSLNPSNSQSNQAKSRRTKEAAETSSGILDEIIDIRQSILHLQNTTESYHPNLRIASSYRSEEAGVVDQEGYHSQSSSAMVAAELTDRRLRVSHHVKKPLTRLRQKIRTDVHRRLWMPLVAVSLEYQHDKFREAHHQTFVSLYQQLKFSIEPLTSLLPSLIMYVARDHAVPRIHMRLQWTQFIGRREFHRILGHKDDTLIKQDIESRRLSVNAIDERGKSLLSYVKEIFSNISYS